MVVALRRHGVVFNDKPHLIAVRPEGYRPAGE